MCLPGPPGPPGAPGPRGRKGARGRRGQKGRTGNRGDQGIMGPPGRSGKQGIKGPIGMPGEVGPKGQKGNRGPRGIPGAKGEPGESISAPVVAVSPLRITVNESGSASFQCSVSGNPEPAIVWRKLGKQSEIHQAVDSRGTLVLKNVKASDSGLYNCSAGNVLGRAHSLVRLVVNGKLFMNYCFRVIKAHRLSKTQLFLSDYSSAHMSHVSGKKKIKLAKRMEYSKVNRRRADTIEKHP